MKDENEQALFRELEQGTNHRQLLKLTERIARSGWLLLALAIGHFLLLGETPLAYALLMTALALLGMSLFLGYQADQVRRRIQDQVDEKLRKR